MTNLSIFDLTGKVAVITGGSTGIGRAMAEGLAEAGCNIVIGSRNYVSCAKACDEIAELGVKAIPVQCDVCNTDEVENMIQYTRKEMGKVDILVNNSGIESREIPFHQTPEQEWDKVINVNLKGVFLCSRAAAAEMIKTGGGKIINVASIAAFVAMRNVSAYSASKGGLVQLTRSMAVDLAKYNIQVNAICPGFVSTAMSARLYDDETWKKIVRRHVPMERMGKPGDFKGTAIYLASSASDFMTGSCIVLDGGQHIW